MNRLKILVMISLMGSLVLSSCNKDDARNSEDQYPPVQEKFRINRLIRLNWGTFSDPAPDTLDSYGTVYLYKDSTAKFVINTDKYMAYNVLKDSTGVILNLERWYYESDTAIVFSKIPYYYSAIVHNDDDQGETTRLRIETGDKGEIIWRYRFHFHIPDVSHQEGMQPEDRFADNKLFLTRQN